MLIQFLKFHVCSRCKKGRKGADGRCYPERMFVDTGSRRIVQRRGSIVHDLATWTWKFEQDGAIRSVNKLCDGPRA